MRSSIIATLLIACLLFSQLPNSASAQTLPQPSVTVHAQTVVPVTLVNPIKNKSTKPGDSVRAVVAFPVTVGDQLAIPAGTYVEGTLLPPAPKVKHKPDPGTQLHFTRLIFANGYTVTLDATEAEATLPLPFFDSPAGIADSIADSNIGKGVLTLMGYADGQALPTLPPLHNPGPNPAVIIGPTLGVVAAVILLGIFGHHKAANNDYIVHDAGWQFQMKLASPLTLDPALAAASSK